MSVPIRYQCGAIVTQVMCIHPRPADASFAWMLIDYRDSGMFYSNAIGQE